MPTAIPAISVATALKSAARRTFAQNCLWATTSTTMAATWMARPMTSPISSRIDSSPVTRSATFTTIAATMYSSRIHQAMRLRAANAAASRARTNAHAKLVSGKLKT